MVDGIIWDDVGVGSNPAFPVDGNTLVKDSIGKIIGYGINNDPHNIFVVEFYNHVLGHSGDLNGKRGYCWAVEEEDIKLNGIKQLEFKFGDIPKSG